jgi:2-methylcitrate dehydratase PrpD
MSASIDKTFFEYCAGIRFEDLPQDVVHETKRLILDTVGCGLGGYEVEKGKIGVELVRRMGGTGEASVVGMRGKFPSAQAAFGNGELMHELDWCSVQAPSHVSPYVLPPVLAIAEAKRKSGKDLITAMALASEVSGRLGTVIGGLRATPGGFRRRVWGISTNQIGGTAGVANLLGFDARKMGHALGVSGYFAPLATHVKYNHTVEVGYPKYGPSGWMAQGAVTSALLVDMGYRGDPTFLEGEHGFYPQNGAQAWNPAKLVERLGQDWVFMHVGYKRWPSNGMNQSSIDVFVDLIERHDLQPEEFDEVVMNTEAFAGLEKYVNTEPNDHVEAASSGPYAMAVAACRIPRGPGMQARSVIEDPRIRRFMKKVRHGVDPRSEVLRRRDLEEEGRPYLRHRPAHIVVKARGQVFEGSTEFARWFSIDPAWRATDDELAGKFRENASIVLDSGKAEKAIDQILGLEKMDDVSVLLDSLAN